MIDEEGRLRQILELVEAVEAEFHAKQYIYPELAVPVALPANGAAWTYGALTQIIPVATIGFDYDIRSISITALSANASYSLRFTYGAGDTEWAFASVTRAAAAIQSLVVPIQGVIIPANSIFKGQVADSVGTSTVAVKVYYRRHY